MYTHARRSMCSLIMPVIDGILKQLLFANSHTNLYHQATIYIALHVSCNLLFYSKMIRAVVCNLSSLIVMFTFLSYLSLFATVMKALLSQVSNTKQPWCTYIMFIDKFSRQGLGEECYLSMKCIQEVTVIIIASSKLMTGNKYQI